MKPDSPVRQIWQALKTATPGALVLIKLGDFYEAFEGDAVILAKTCGLTLTARQGTPMAGFVASHNNPCFKQLKEAGIETVLAEYMPRKTP